MKRFLFQSIIGILFGAFIMVVITNIIYLNGNETLSGQLFLQNSIAFLFSGWFFAVTPLIFEIKSFNLIQQTILHFLLVIVLFFILSIGVEWVPFNFMSILLFIGLFIFIYACIWVGFYIYFRKEAKKLNDDLLNMQ